MGIFVVQGAMVGVIGTLAGLLLGLLHRLQHRRDRAGAGAAVGRQLPAQGHLPHQPHAQRPAGADIVPIGVISLVLAFVATLPSWRASRVNPRRRLFALNNELVRLSCAAGPVVLQPAAVA